MIIIQFDLFLSRFPFSESWFTFILYDEGSLEALLKTLIESSPTVERNFPLIARHTFCFFSVSQDFIQIVNALDL